jgi:hypothetical protein
MVMQGRRCRDSDAGTEMQGRDAGQRCRDGDAGTEMQGRDAGAEMHAKCKVKPYLRSLWILSTGNWSPALLERDLDLPALALPPLPRPDILG